MSVVTFGRAYTSGKIPTKLFDPERSLAYEKCTIGFLVDSAETLYVRYLDTDETKELDQNEVSHACMDMLAEELVKAVFGENESEFGTPGLTGIMVNRDPWMMYVRAKGLLSIVSLLVLVGVDTLQSTELVNKVASRMELDNSPMYGLIVTHAEPFTKNTLVHALLLKLAVTLVLVLGALLCPPLKRVPLVMILASGAHEAMDGETTEVIHACVTLCAVAVACVAIQVLDTTKAHNFDQNVQTALRVIAPLAIISSVAYKSVKSRDESLQLLASCARNIPRCVAGSEYQFVRLGDTIALPDDADISDIDKARMVVLSLLDVAIKCVFDAIKVVAEFKMPEDLAKMLASKFVVAPIILVARRWDAPRRELVPAIMATMFAHATAKDTTCIIDAIVPKSKAAAKTVWKLL